jgi:hypothetical protein
LNYKPPVTPHPRRRDSNSNNEISDDNTSGMTFVQSGTVVAGTDGKKYERIKCFNCEDFGHYSSVCPKPQAGVQLLQTTASTVSEQDFSDSEEDTNFTFAIITDITLQQSRQSDNMIPDTWILLDSESTVSIFKNKNLVSNIRDSQKQLRIHTNGGTQVSSKVATLKNFGQVWFNPSSLANILSLAAVRKVWRITMDTDIEAAFNVHKKDGTVIKFLEYKNGLYYHDTMKQNKGKQNPKISTDESYLFVNTVEGNKATYTRQEIEAADRARALYQKLGRPSELFFQNILANNLIRNRPVTVDDAKQSFLIYGPDLAVLKGKTVKKQNKGTPDFRPMIIPAPIIEKYRNLRIFADLFYVNGNLFFHTIGEHVLFRTVANIKNRTKGVLLKCITT